MAAPLACGSILRVVTADRLRRINKWLLAVRAVADAGSSGCGDGRSIDADIAAAAMGRSEFHDMERQWHGAKFTMRRRSKIASQAETSCRIMERRS